MSAEQEKHGKALVARLWAVQGVYQAMHSGQSLAQVEQEYLYGRRELPEDEAGMPRPDGVLFKMILDGVAERRADLEGLIDAHIRKDNKEIEALLKSILLCAGWELLAQPGADAPIIINDYLDIAHGFYQGGEVGFLNGVLDALARAVR